MKFIFTLMCGLALAGCQKTFVPGNYPVYEYSKALDKESTALKYDRWSVSKETLFEKNKELKALREEIEALRAVLIVKANQPLKEGGVVRVCGVRRSAFSMAVSRIGLSIDEENFHYENPCDEKVSYLDIDQTRIPVSGIMGSSSAQQINHVDLARLETLFYFSALKYGEIELSKTMLRDLAKKENLPVEDYIKKYINPDEIRVGDEELNLYFERKNILIEELSKKNKEDIRLSLLSQKMMERRQFFSSRYLYKKSIKVSLQLPKFEFGKTPKKPFSRGHGDVSIVVSSPYNCQPCIAWHKQLLEVLRLHEGDIEVDYYPSFSERDKKSRLFFESALCLSEQDKTIFWKLLAEVKTLGNISKLEHRLLEFASQENLQVDTVKACMVHKKYFSTIEYYQDFSDYLELKSYPLVQVGGFVFAGVIHQDYFNQALDVERRRSSMSLWAKVSRYLKGLFKG